jgi:hypothetical protein
MSLNADFERVARDLRLRRAWSDPGREGQHRRENSVQTTLRHRDLPCFHPHGSARSQAVARSCNAVQRARASANRPDAERHLKKIAA